MNPILAKAEELDYPMLEGVFFTEVHQTEQYIIACHEKSTDHYSNVCSRIRCTADDAENVFEEIMQYFKEHDRTAAFSLSPFVEPDDFTEILRARDFAPDFKDVWMFYPGECIAPPLPASVSIKTVSNQEELTQFIDTFNSAYSGDDPDEPYGEAPPEWGETFQKGFGLNKADREVAYYILYKDEKPASVLLTSALSGFAGIYAVGTSPSMRGNGLATILTLHAVKDLYNQGVEHVFLQTLKDSLNEKLYKRIGFVTEWEAETWLPRSQSDAN